MDKSLVSMDLVHLRNQAAQCNEYSKGDRTVWNGGEAGHYHH